MEAFFTYILLMKDKLIKSTIILLAGGFATKILGMFIKMVMGRMLGSDVLGLYMMILPTFSLFIGLGQFGMPTAMSKLIAEDRKNNKNLFFSSLIILLIINIALVFIINLIAPILSNNLLKNNNTYYGIVAISLVIPFISISSLCRSYFFGKERMGVHVISNIVEDIVRLLVMIMGIPIFISKDISYLVCFLILSNVISESVSILILFLFLPKDIVFRKKDFIINKDYIKDSLSIGIPNTTSRLVGSVGYFLEPIILTNVLSYVGYSSSYITREYGVLSGYVMPILLLPSFFTGAISQALLPVLSKEYSNGRKDNAKKKLFVGIFISLSIGVLCTLIFMIIPDILLSFIYKTNSGVSYMRVLAPICLLQYIQSPISSCLDATNNSKYIMKANIIGMIIRCLLLGVFSLFKIGIWGLIIAISVNVVVITIYEVITLYRVFK